MFLSFFLSPPLCQEWSLDTMVVLGPLQHFLWDWLSGPSEVVQQPCSAIRRQGLCRTKQRGAVRVVPHL